ELRVEAAVALWVLISSLLAATFTVSASWPTSSVALIEAGVAHSTRTSRITAVLKPLSETVTTYTPGDTLGTLNSPSPLETASKATPDSFLTVTVAPGRAPPALSTTVPLIEAFAPCANAETPARTASKASTDTRSAHRVIKAPPP